MTTVNKVLKREFLRLVEEQPFITAPKVAQELGLSERTIYRYATALKIKLTPKKEYEAVTYLKTKGYEFN